MSDNKPTNGELMVMMEGLKEAMEKGFAGVYKRQDHTNGCVTDNTNWRMENKKDIEEVVKSHKNILMGAVKTIWGVAMMLALAFLGIRGN